MYYYYGDVLWRCIMCLVYNDRLKRSKNKYLKIMAMQVANVFRNLDALGYAFTVNKDSIDGSIIHNNMDISCYKYFYSFSSQILYKVM